MMAVPPDTKLPFPGLGTDPHSVRQRVEALEKLMERMFVVPVLNRPIGLDVILDLVPIAGSTAAAALRLSGVGSAQTSAVEWHGARKAGNIGVDWVWG